MAAKTKTLAAGIALVILALGALWLLPKRAASPSVSFVGNVPAAASSPGTVRRPRAPPRAGEEETTSALHVDQEPSADDVAAARAKWPIRIVTNVPRARVTVSLRYAEEPDPAPMTKATDARGFAGFALPHRSDRPGWCGIVARAAGFKDEGFSTTQFLDRELHVTMNPGAMVRGRIVDSGGGPLEGADVRIGDNAWATRADGTFEAARDTPGPVTIRVTHVACLAREVLVTAPSDDLCIALERGLEVRGRVTFPDMRPIAFASAWSMSPVRPSSRSDWISLPTRANGYRSVFARRLRTDASRTASRVPLPCSTPPFLRVATSSRRLDPVGTSSRRMSSSRAAPRRTWS
jgi:hypothetical protein